MQLLPLLVVVQDFLRQLRNVNARVTLTGDVEIVALELAVLREELDQRHQIVPGH